MVRERTKELSEAPIIRAAFFWPGAHVLILTALHRDGRHHLAEFPEEIEEGIRRPVVPAAGLHLYVIDGVRDDCQIHGTIQGITGGGWLLIDYGDVIVHIFSPDRRAYYSLEDLYKESKVLLRGA